MNVVAVVAVAVELVLRHPFAFVDGGVGEGLFGVGPAAGLSVDVAGHVEGVGDVGDELGVLFAARPRVLGEGGAFEAVNDVVMQAGMFGDAGKESAQDGDGLGAAGGGGFLVGEGETAHDHEGEIELGLDFAGVRGEQGAETFDEVLFGVLGVGLAAGGDGGDVHLLQVGGFAGDLGELDGFLGGDAGARGGGRDGLAEEGAREYRSGSAGANRRRRPWRCPIAAWGRRGRARRPGGSCVRLRGPRRSASGRVPDRRSACASGLEVVMARWTVPMPGRSLAGRVGARELGGGAQLSAALGCCAKSGEGEGKECGEFHGWFSSWREIRLTS